MALLALVFSGISLLTASIMLYRLLQVNRALSRTQQMLNLTNQDLLKVSDALMDVSEGIRLVRDGSIHPVLAFAPSGN